MGIYSKAYRAGHLTQDVVLLSPAAHMVLSIISVTVGALTTGIITVAAAIWPDHLTAISAVAGALAGIVSTIAGAVGLSAHPEVEHDDDGVVARG